MRTSLLTDGRVTQMSRKLSRSRHAVIGTLFEFWCLGDLHADEFGVLGGWSENDIDDHLRCPGFCSAMPGDWLFLDSDGSVKLPEYREHNGVTAKTRALAQKRQKRSRESRHAVVTVPSRSKRDASTLILSSTESTRKGVQRETKTPYGENKNVPLSDSELGTLRASYGEQIAQAILLLDAWIESKPGKLAWFEKKYSSAFSVLNPKSSWVRERLADVAEKAKPKTKETNRDKNLRILYGDRSGDNSTPGIPDRSISHISARREDPSRLVGATSEVQRPAGQTGVGSLHPDQRIGIPAGNTPAHQGDQRKRLTRPRTDGEGAAGAGARHSGGAEDFENFDE